MSSSSFATGKTKLGDGRPLGSGLSSSESEGLRRVWPSTVWSCEGAWEGSSVEGGGGGEEGGVTKESDMVGSEGSSGERSRRA